ncbi:MAG: EamA family transporter [Fibrobacterota bacterium]
MIVGIFLGLGAALGQSVSYVFSRAFVTQHKEGSYHLMVLAHLIMGFLSATALVLLWPDQIANPATVFRLVAGAAIFYLIAQTSLFLTLSTVEASRIAPLLGMKVFFLAALSIPLLGKQLSPVQWSAVILSSAAAALLNRIGGKLPLKSIAGVAVSVICYSLSDINIKQLIDSLSYLSIAHASAFSVAALYLLCGIVAVPFALIGRKHRPEHWKGATPYAISWFCGMFFLFSCFATIGVVYGNIVQSTRGILSIIIGAAVAHMGHVSLEQKTDKNIFIRRIFAAVLMTAAIVIFYIG